MGRLTDDRFLKEGFYQPKSKEEAKEIRSMANDLTFEKLYRHCADVEKENERLHLELTRVRKETAEKFKKLLKALVADRNCNEDYDWEDVQVDGQIFVECVDEICKEITEGKVKE